MRRSRDGALLPAPGQPLPADKQPPLHGSRPAPPPALPLRSVPGRAAPRHGTAPTRPHRAAARGPLPTVWLSTGSSRHLLSVKRPVHDPPRTTEATNDNVTVPASGV